MSMRTRTGRHSTDGTIPLRNPRILEASADVKEKDEWLNEGSHNESPNHAFF